VLEATASSVHGEAELQKGNHTVVDAAIDDAACSTQPGGLERRLRIDTAWTAPSQQSAWEPDQFDGNAPDSGESSMASTDMQMPIGGGLGHDAVKDSHNRPGSGFAAQVAKGASSCILDLPAFALQCMAGTESAWQQSDQNCARGARHSIAEHDSENRTSAMRCAFDTAAKVCSPKRKRDSMAQCTAPIKQKHVFASFACLSRQRRHGRWHRQQSSGRAASSGVQHSSCAGRRSELNVGAGGGLHLGKCSLVPLLGQCSSQLHCKGSYGKRTEPPEGNMSLAQRGWQAL
jgi:hypothetical protein